MESGHSVFYRLGITVCCKNTEGAIAKVNLLNLILLNFAKLSLSLRNSSKLFDPFLWMGLICLKAAELLREDGLLFFTKFPGLPCTQLINQPLKDEGMG